MSFRVLSFSVLVSTFLWGTGVVLAADTPSEIVPEDYNKQNVTEKSGERLSDAVEEVAADVRGVAVVDNEEAVVEELIVVKEKKDEHVERDGADTDSALLEEEEEIEVAGLGEDISSDVDEESDSDFTDKFIKGRLQIGTRLAHRFLTKDDSGHKGGVYGSGTYLGTIYALDEKQNYAPLQVYGRYFFNKYVGVELSYDQIKVETVAFDSYTRNIKTDGDVELSGPAINLHLRYPNSSKFTPYLGIGAGFYSANFDAKEAWTYSPRYKGRAYNDMELSNVTGFLFGVGTEWAFAEKWRLDLSAQYTSVDVDAVFHGYYDSKLYTTQPGHFPADNIAIRLGVAFQF